MLPCDIITQKLMIPNWLHMFPCVLKVMKQMWQLLQLRPNFIGTSANGVNELNIVLI